MKRKYLSALLMGVLTLSSVSTFTSCKDYDDDISNLQGQIDKLATADQLSQKVAELQALISSNKSDITSLQAKLADKTTLDEVKAVLADYATKQYVNDADKTLQDAIDALKTGDIAKLKEDVVKAQAAADKAAADAEKANADIVETLKTLATKTELKDAADAAQKAIEALESKNAEDLKKAQEAITETLKNYAEEGDKKTLESLAETIKNASDALALANTNKQAIADALKLLGEGYSAENTVAAAIEAIKAQIGTPNKELGTLESRLAAIEGVLNGVKDDETKLGLATKVTNIENNLKDIIGEYTTMVTEVSLVGSFLNTGGVSALGSTSLDFVSGTVAQNITFGKAEKDDKGVEVPSATNQQAFVKGTTFNNKKEILVRVNPTNAVLTKASIKLVDSQGNNLDNILEIGEPKKYEGLLTRGSNNTGLWTIPVTVKDGVAKGDIEKKNNAGHILYAVAINNTSSEAAKDRYVASTYDITVPAAADFHPATETELDNNVKLWSVSTMTKDHPVTLGNVRKTAGSTSGTPVSAKNGETIKISFNHLQNKVKYFYVVRDDSHVDENTSGSSAINAWKSYKYEGNAYGNVVEVDPSNPTGELKITINGTVGDEIGFRLFAMNYDGTLTPVPGTNVGGKGFVVYVGDDQSQTSVAGSLTAAKANGNSTGWLAISGKLKGTVSLPSSARADVNGKTINFTVQYSTDGNAPVATTGANNKDIKFVKFTTATAMTDWKDDAKANFVLSTKNTTTGMVENEISVSLTKVLPDVAYTKKHFNYTWKDEQLVDNKYKAYVTPVATVTNPWSAAATEGYQKLTQAITGLNTTVSTTTPEVGFHINVDGIKKNATTNKWEAVDFTAANSWKVTVPAELIDGKTEHKTTISYNYGKVSSDKKDDNGNYVLTLETVQTVFACPLTDAVQKYTWSKYTKNVGTTAKPVYKDLDVNYLVYNKPATVENVNLLEYILGTNDYYNDEFGGKLLDLVYGTAAKKYVSIEDVQLVSDQSGKQDYFKVTGYNPITFTVNSEASNPVKDVKSWLKFTVVDAFGHKIPYQMPFTVKRAQ